jgi:hypothetical protein
VVTYRVGGKLGRTIYRNDELIGIMDTREDGALVVEALNARERVLAGSSQARGRAEVPSGPATCGRVGLHDCGITGTYHSHDSGYPQVRGPAEEVPPSEPVLLPNEEQAHGIIDTSQETVGEHMARCGGCA